MASLSTLRCCIVSSSSSVQNKNLGRHQKYQRTRLRAKRDDDEKNDENSKLPEFEVRIQNLCDFTFVSRHRRQSDGGEDRILGESLNQSFFIEKFRFLPSSSSLFEGGSLIFFPQTAYLFSLSLLKLTDLSYFTLPS